MQSFLPNPNVEPSTSSQISQMEKLKKKLDQADTDNLSLKVQCKKVVCKKLDIYILRFPLYYIKVGANLVGR
jgi:hypothetical protein